MTNFVKITMFCLVAVFISAGTPMLQLLHQHGTTAELPNEHHHHSHDHDSVPVQEEPDCSVCLQIGAISTYVYEIPILDGFYKTICNLNAITIARPYCLEAISDLPTRAPPA